MPTPFTYASGETPADYVCARCGAKSCKLWRLYQTFLDHQELTCAPCSGEAEGYDVSEMDDRGFTPRRSRQGQRSDSIGWRVPAVPTEDGYSYWGYTSVPQDGVEWWWALPNRPAEEAYHV